MVSLRWSCCDYYEMVSQKQLVRAWQALEEREMARALSTRRLGRYESPEVLFYSSRLGRTREAKEDNRYSNVIAYDRTLVVPDGKRYLNANVVSDGKDWWVAAQAPMPHTFWTFFRAILTTTASSARVLQRPPPKSLPKDAILVQLTGWTERGMPKADPYLPASSSKDITFQPPDDGLPITLHQETQEQVNRIGSVYRNLQLGDGQQEMKLHHYLFGGWPDHGVPADDDLAHLQNLVEHVINQREKLGGSDVEVWVHCSAGVGRTGTFLLLASALSKSTETIQQQPSPLGPFPVQDSLAARVDAMREYRPMLVQTPVQLELLYNMLS